MTVQLPVLLWTVICFGALILILQNLLFKPVLLLLDRRAERIAKAAARDAENRRLRSEADEALKRFREEEQKHISDLSESALTDAHREADAQLSDAAVRNADRLKRTREELAAESVGIRQTLDGKAEELMHAWLSSLIS